MCSLLAILASADIGSPWVPVVIITSSLSLYLDISFKSTNISSSISKYPNSLATPITLTIDLPDIATFLLHFLAISIICCSLCILEENVATIILLSPALLNKSSSPAPTVLSDIVYPGLSTLVLSASNKSTPSWPNSHILCKSIISPSIGVKSILKSPVWYIIPWSVWTAIEHAPGILWLFLINSTLIFASLIICLGVTTFNLAVLNLCSFNLTCINPILSIVPYTGTSIFFRMYGRAPIWSSWPCVIKIPLILSRFWSR